MWEGHAGQTQATSIRMQNPFGFHYLSVTVLSGIPGYLVERDCYMRAARNLGYLRLQFRTPLASPLTSLSLQNTPNNQFVPSLPSPIDMLVCDLHFVRVYYPSCGRASHVCVTLSRTRARVRAQLALALSWDLCIRLPDP